MAVLDPDAPTHVPVFAPVDVGARAEATIRVEPLVGLEWSRAVEAPGGVGVARQPADRRRAWIHRAPERQVLALYNSVRAVVPEPPAPWWLRGLAGGRLPSRAAGFAVEDEVAAVLGRRPGWVYMPWTDPGEDGYWEYVSSELSGDGLPRVPTAVLLTDRHGGWLDLLPAHSTGAPDPLPISGVAALAARIAELERL